MTARELNNHWQCAAHWKALESVGEAVSGA